MAKGVQTGALIPSPDRVSLSVRHCIQKSLEVKRIFAFHRMQLVITGCFGHCHRGATRVAFKTENYSEVCFLWCEAERLKYLGPSFL